MTDEGRQFASLAGTMDAHVNAYSSIVCRLSLIVLPLVTKSQTTVVLFGIFLLNYGASDSVTIL